MTTIYIVYSCMDYGGKDAIRAFCDESAAHAFRLECELYHSKQPKFDDAFWGDAVKMAEYDEAFEAWCAGHPCGRRCINDDFFKVQPLDLVP